MALLFLSREVLGVVGGFVSSIFIYASTTPFTTRRRAEDPRGKMKRLDVPFQLLPPLERRPTVTNQRSLLRVRQVEMVRVRHWTMFVKKQLPDSNLLLRNPQPLRYRSYCAAAWDFCRP